MVESPIEKFYWKEIENNKEKKEEPKEEKNNKKEEEKKLKTLVNYLSKEKFEEFNKLKKIANDSINEAQDYIRKKK